MNQYSRLAIVLSLLTISPFVFASGFFIPLQSVADLGQANAGGAALAIDATTNFTNPAGMMRLDRPQFSAAGVGVQTSMRYWGTGGATAVPPNISARSESGTSYSDDAGLVPSFHYVRPMSNKWALGLSLTVPYGLGENYGDTAVTRYNIIKAKAASFDLGPSAAYRITDQVSFGAGPDALYFTSSLFYAANLTPLASDGISSVDIAGWGFGWHAGLLYEPCQRTRIGLSYHSKILVHANGTSSLTVPAGGFLANATYKSNMSTNIPLPPMTTLSLFQDINDQWSLMGTVRYMQWEVYKNEHAYNIASIGTTIPSANVTRNWHNTFFFSLGTNYKLSDKWLLRVGGSYEQSALNDRTADAVVADLNRVGVGIGARLTVNRNMWVDFAYTRAFSRPMRINYTSETAGGSTLNGRLELKPGLFGVQGTWVF